MFRCQKTGKVSAPGEKPIRVVVATRFQTYTNDRGPKREPYVTHGYEIVKELLVCQEAADKIIAEQGGAVPAPQGQAPKPAYSSRY